MNLSTRETQLFAEVLVVGMSALVLAACSSPAPRPRAVSTPATELVGPYELTPQFETTEEAATGKIKRAFGSMLESVSVKEVFLGTYDDGGDKQMGLRIEYHLVDCETPVVTYDMDLISTGIVPPITHIYETPPRRDAMPAERFRILLRAYGKATQLPFGALERYRTAMRYSGDDLSPDGLTSAFGGKPRALDDLWVITPGAENQEDFLKLRYHNNPPGYVFEFPEGGTPTYLGKVDDIGETADIGD